MSGRRVRKPTTQIGGADRCAPSAGTSGPRSGESPSSEAEAGQATANKRPGSQPMTSRPRRKRFVL